MFFSPSGTKKYARSAAQRQTKVIHKKILVFLKKGIENHVIDDMVSTEYAGIAILGLKGSGFCETETTRLWGFANVFTAFFSP